MFMKAKISWKPGVGFINGQVSGVEYVCLSEFQVFRVVGQWTSEEISIAIYNILEISIVYRQ